MTRKRNIHFVASNAGEAQAAMGSLKERYGQSELEDSDVIVALARLADSDHPEREEVLADFERRWRAEPLVMDKWFSVQAVANRSDTLDRVRGLMGHAAFSIGNPNKVRALIGAFAGGNPVRFHAADGAGYAFLERQVLDLDLLALAHDQRVLHRVLQLTNVARPLIIQPDFSLQSGHDHIQ